VRLLLEKGANVSVAREDVWTALYETVAKVVKRLLGCCWTREQMYKPFIDRDGLHSIGLLRMGMR
jgi:hypothetical protein